MEFDVVGARARHAGPARGQHRARQVRQASALALGQQRQRVQEALKRQPPRALRAGSWRVSMVERVVTFQEAVNM